MRLVPQARGLSKSFHSLKQSFNLYAEPVKEPDSYTGLGLALTLLTPVPLGIYFVHLLIQTYTVINTTTEVVTTGDCVASSVQCRAVGGCVLAFLGRMRRANGFVASDPGRIDMAQNDMRTVRLCSGFLSSVDVSPKNAWNGVSLPNDSVIPMAGAPASTHILGNVAKGVLVVWKYTDKSDIPRESLSLMARSPHHVSLIPHDVYDKESTVSYINGHSLLAGGLVLNPTSKGLARLDPTKSFQQVGQLVQSPPPHPAPGVNVSPLDIEGRLEIGSGTKQLHFPRCTSISNGPFAGQVGCIGVSKTAGIVAYTLSPRTGMRISMTVVQPCVCNDRLGDYSPFLGISVQHQAIAAVIWDKCCRTNGDCAPMSAVVDFKRPVAGKPSVFRSATFDMDRTDSMNGEWSVWVGERMVGVAQAAHGRSRFGSATRENASGIELRQIAQPFTLFYLRPFALISVSAHDAYFELREDDPYNKQYRGFPTHTRTYFARLNSNGNWPHMLEFDWEELLNATSCDGQQLDLFSGDIHRNLLNSTVLFIAFRCKENIAVQTVSSHR